jgi:hypothetical protein
MITFEENPGGSPSISEVFAKISAHLCGLCVSALSLSFSLPGFYAAPGNPIGR